MQYREVGDTGIKISTLGIGTMRFKGKENAAEMIAAELDLGLNYFDIGPAYAFKSFDDNAEVWTGEAIKGVPREKMVLSSKAQPRKGEPRVEASLGINSRDQMWQCMENSLKRTGMDWLDFYQLWDMSADDHFEAACVGDDSPLKAMREAKDQGLIKHLGFTSHGKADDIIKWLEAVPDFKFITIYYNLNDRSLEKAVEYARTHGIGVACMGPLRGGILAGESGAFARAIPALAGLPIQEIALRFLLGTPGVTTVLSGMNDMAHLEQNAKVASLEEPMTPEQREGFIAAFQDFTHGEPLCSNCNYCAGACPEGLPVANAMSLYQLHAVFGVPSAANMLLGAFGEGKKDVTVCTACGACVEKCPQKLPIPDRMEKLAAVVAALQS